MKQETVPVSRQAYDLIKSKIFRNEFGSRERINDTRLAQELKMSRTPIREALIVLEKEGLISRFGGTRGFYLRPFSIKDVYDLYEFRQMIELAAVESAVTNLTDADLDRLDRILSGVDEIILQGGRPSEALVRALDFHIQLMEACTHNTFVIETLKSCYDKLVVISWSCHNQEMSEKSAKDHGQIMKALRDRDARALEQHIRQHITNARDRAMSIIQVDTQKIYIMP